MKRLRGLAPLVACLLASHAHALPLISEVLYDAVGSDDGSVFVEIAGAPGTSLAGLSLEGVNGSDGSVTVSIPLSGTIGSDGLFVVADQASGGGTAVPGADLLADFDFQNGPDSVVLRSASSVLDAVGYGAFGPGDVFAGEGSPAPDPAAGQSIARRFSDVDTGDNAADFVALATPTPGSAPRQSVPEPATAALLCAAGCFGLRRGARR
jgi:hypothetical protein